MSDNTDLLEEEEELVGFGDVSNLEILLIHTDLISLHRALGKYYSYSWEVFGWVS